MLRRSVTIYLAFVLAVGPALCCCTTASVVAAPNTAGRGQPAQPAPSAPSCCCCKADPAAKGKPVAESAQTDHKPADHKCPCQQKGGKTFDRATASVSVQEIGRPLPDSAPFAVFEFLTACPVNLVIDSGGRHAPPGHRLVAQELLHAHHLLRC